MDAGPRPPIAQADPGRGGEDIDPLTGLILRRRLLDIMAAALARPAHPDARPALLTLDLDRFKAVNDTFGHSMGDELLHCVAERLRRGVREDDLVARLGGDEFAILANVGGDMEATCAGSLRNASASSTARAACCGW
jgi:diguanylate cyclase